jgi:hypothetical protein
LVNLTGDVGLAPCDVPRVHTLLDSACFLVADLGWTAYRTCYAAERLEQIGSSLALIVACLIGIVLILARPWLAASVSRRGKRGIRGCTGYSHRPDMH